MKNKQDPEGAPQEAEDPGEAVPGGVPATPTDVPGDVNDSRSVAGAAPTGDALQHAGDEDAPGDAGISSSGNSVGDDTEGDAERVDTTPDEADEAVPPTRRG